MAFGEVMPICFQQLVSVEGLVACVGMLAPVEMFLGQISNIFRLRW